ncbi:unnamed protein product [Bursaphelenchus okinawaensis]|uniref:ATP synthase subunit d, mitochondrial n=1 Tax=Bursaphelenchus okinawaensis TaxID=465554 RepID=A0A811JW93_9BILA|nr:unnamed protein product [Bursaphelenchus okinawaensis]CAG9086088.1 unnamed protein product [Bursaphelenchus okinawaensis]
MSAAKRVAQSSVNWAKLSEKLIANHQAELTKLKGQNSTFGAVVNTLPADLPKVDFAQLKKELPDHAKILDSLQKQFEAIKIPYGEVPKDLSAEVDKWVQFNEARVKLNNLKAADGAAEAKKKEEKWANAPPVEQMCLEHLPQYFPHKYADLRYEKRIPDPCDVGFNEAEALETRFRDYKVLRRPDKVDDH